MPEPFFIAWRKKCLGYWYKSGRKLNLPSLSKVTTPKAECNSQKVRQRGCFRVVCPQQKTGKHSSLAQLVRAQDC